MTKFYDDPSPQIEEQICGKVEPPRRRAGGSPSNSIAPQWNLAGHVVRI